MTRYRLKPVDLDLWVVQYKGWLFWRDYPHDCDELWLPMWGPAYRPKYVRSVAEGEQFIVELRKAKTQAERTAMAARGFLRANKPVEF